MVGEPDRLSEPSRQLLRDPESELFFSAASAWEIAIKYAAGKLRLPRPPAALLGEWLAEDRLSPCPFRSLTPCTPASCRRTIGILSIAC
jgi:PIN domain nuclease of toxin-antitoxin system